MNNLVNITDLVTESPLEDEVKDQIRKFRDGWEGKLIDSVNVVNYIVLGRDYIPPQGIEAAFDNFSEDYDEGYFETFPELDSEDRRLVVDLIESVKVKKKGEDEDKDVNEIIELVIRRDVYAMYQKELPEPSKIILPKGKDIVTSKSIK